MLYFKKPVKRNAHYGKILIERRLTSIGKMLYNFFLVIDDISSPSNVDIDNVLFLHPLKMITTEFYSNCEFESNCFIEIDSINYYTDLKCKDYEYWFLDSKTNLATLSAQSKL